MLIAIQISAALWPFMASYLLWRYAQKLRLRLARKYFDHIKAGPFWSQINRQTFMHEEQIYAYDFKGLGRPGEHFLHPCIRGLRERKMYAQMPEAERIRKRYCWAIRMVGVLWLACFFSAFYVSVISLKITGDASGHLFGILQLTAQFLPFAAMYVSVVIVRKEHLRLYEDYFNHVRNSEYWPKIIRQDFMQKVLKLDPTLELYRSPLFDPFPEYDNQGRHGFDRGFLTPSHIHFYEYEMYDKIPELKKMWKQYRQASLKNTMMGVTAFFASFIGTILIMTKIGDAAGLLLRLA